MTETDENMKEGIAVVLTKKEITALVATILVCHQILHDEKPTMTALLCVAGSTNTMVDVSRKFATALGVE